VIRTLLPERCVRLLDVGCGPLTSAYPYADRAAQVTCLDWKIRTFGTIPANITAVGGDFTELDLPAESFDAIVAADVFEHVLIEREPVFVEKCLAALKPGGALLVSVPHRGTFAWLDPYEVKPTIHRLLWRFGLYDRVHNGSCDIRKGHKHYAVAELAETFKPLQLVAAVHYGYLLDPLLSWVSALSRGSGRFPGYAALERACGRELERDYGVKSFNVAVKFLKSAA
jgi:2-polyprenyl-3-methyl-5-hydroxy-6-metoxy-1,4-benzoquinol methylase